MAKASSIPAPLDSAPLAPPLPQQTPAAPTSAVTALRSNQITKFQTHRFKLTLANARKNTSWQASLMRIEDIEHVHFYNDKGRRGEPLKHANKVGGHTHEVTFKEVNGGLAEITCGPAIVQSSKLMPNGRRNTSLQAVNLGVNPNTGAEEFDRHTHPVQYMKTETFEITA